MGRYNRKCPFLKTHIRSIIRPFQNIPNLPRPGATGGKTGGFAYDARLISAHTSRRMLPDSFFRVFQPLGVHGFLFLLVTPSDGVAKGFTAHSTKVKEAGITFLFYFAQSGDLK